MGHHKWWDCIWDMTFRDPDGNIIGRERKKNILVDQGEKAVVETFLRANDAAYFPSTDFYIGFYRGSIAETTTLLTVPNEPSGNGYSRQVIHRSVAGWPTIEKDDGDYRAISEEVTFTSTGGDIGPFSGGFLCTSLDNLGYLISAVASSAERTILSGASMSLSLKVKVK